MKRTLKKALALLLMMTMLLSLLLSCGGTQTTSSTACAHSYENGVCRLCGIACTHASFDAGVCRKCGFACAHESGFRTGACAFCRMLCPHESYASGSCAECGSACPSHSYEDGICTLCGKACPHYAYKDNFCLYCDVPCPHSYETGTCTLCGGADPDYVKFVLPFNKGLNLSALEGNTVDPSYLFQKSTYENIKGQGFDHVRLPVDFRLFYNNFDKQNKPFWSGNKLNLKSPEEGWALLEQIVDYAEEVGLYIIIDFHGWYDLNTTDKAQEDLYFSCITELATRFSERSDYVVFELINEPHTTEGGNLGAAALNALQNKAFEIIRQTNPTRIVIFAAAEWNGSWMLSKLILPDDPRIAVAIHTYRTIEFTHQGCTWADPSYTYKVPLTNAILAEVLKELNQIVQYMEKTNVPVILNEFGLNINWATEEDSRAYLSYITNFCMKNGIPFTYWDYCQAWGAYQNGKWNQVILDAFFPKEEE